MSAPRTKRTSLVGKSKVSIPPSTNVAASLPHFQPPSVTKQPFTTPLATQSILLQPATAAVTDEATKMQQRLHALRMTMEEDKRQRDERAKQRKASKPASKSAEEQPLSQKEYLKQLQARLEAKKAATKEKVRQVKAAMDKAGEYVAPLGHGQRLALFERVSEEWLKDGQPSEEVEKEQAAAASEQESKSAADVEEKEQVRDDDAEDAGVVIVAAGEEDEDVEAEGHAEFEQARADWLRSLHQPSNAAVALHSSRPTTASSSTSTSSSAAVAAAFARPAPATSASNASPLLAGDSFDEGASAASFQEARQAWLHSVAAKPRATSTPTTTSPTLTAMTSPPTAERMSCYQCYRLFVAGEGRAGGEAGRELCGAECVVALERVERLRAERTQSMRAMEQRILALQHEQQQLAAQEQQLQQTATEEVEDEEKEEAEQAQSTAETIPADKSSDVPLLALPAVAASASLAVLDLPVSARRFTATEEQPAPIVEFPAE